MCRNKELRESDKAKIVETYLTTLNPPLLSDAQLIERMRVVCDALGARKWALLCVSSCEDSMHRACADVVRRITALTSWCGMLVSMYGAQEAAEVVALCEAYPDFAFLFNKKKKKREKNNY